MTTYYCDDQVTLWHGDAIDVLRTMPDTSVDCVVTSPPYYGLRDYGVPGQYGLEPSPAEYVETMRAVFAEVRRVLAADGTLWLNLGDSYSSTPSWGRGSGSSLHGLAPKNLLGMPWRVAFALQADGWILRNAIVWDKPNAMPESVTDRLAITYETVFMFSRSPRYWFDLDSIREPQASVGERHEGRSGYRDEHPSKGRILTRALHPLGRNPGDVWAIPTQRFPEAHFAVFPSALAERCIVAGCKSGGTVLDPFCGSGTTGMVALKHGRRFVGIDLSATYLDLALRTRLAQGALVDDGQALADGRSLP